MGRIRSTLGRQPGAEKRGPWLFDTLDHNLSARAEAEETFYLNRSQPIEKSGFVKINTSKCKLFY
jgi:hypothetical protein